MQFPESSNLQISIILTFERGQKEISERISPKDLCDIKMYKYNKWKVYNMLYIGRELFGNMKIHLELFELNISKLIGEKGHIHVFSFIQIFQG